MRIIVRSNSPDAVTRISDSASCAATSARVSRCPPRLGVVRPSLAMPTCNVAPLKRIAGRTPANTAASAVAPSAMAITRPSGVVSSEITM